MIIIIKAFLDNYSLRPSCYNCNSKLNNIDSDITIGDLWGADEIVPEINDDKGISLVFINSKQGEKLFHMCKEYIICKQVSGQYASKFNPSLIQCVSMPSKRELFF